VSYKLSSFAALLVLGASAPAVATAVQTPTPRATNAAPAAAQTPPTRAGLLKNVDATFKALDTNGDGTLNSSEIAAAEVKSQQQRVTAARGRLDGEFAKLDTNRDGQLSKAEFMAIAPQASSAAPNPASIISQIDKNKDGKVSQDEYRAPMLARFDKLDTNHDGTISATERQAAQAAARPTKR
jgi:Ca2+-binding EF-hand superfamily protein